jgi:hypothetical protein
MYSSVKEEEIIIITHKRNIEFLYNYCDKYLVDGTLINKIFLSTV